MIQNFIPQSLKPLLRFLYYKNEREKVFREIKIRRQQNNILSTYQLNSIENLIVFLCEGTNWFTGKDDISGGILSIASIYEETRKLTSIHNSFVIMATHPDAHLLFKHTQFPNDIPVFRFSQLKLFRNLKSVMIHVPEYQFNKNLTDRFKSTFQYLCVKNIHINILNQRIDIMPSPSIINSISKEGFYITQTTAHEQYSTLKNRQKYGIPLHKLSVYATPERYAFNKLERKENLILVSPDEVEHKKSILQKLKEELPYYTIRIINGISYMEYLELVSKAKFTITFGEGLDFYFIETIYSGGISFAKYNREFFTADFEKLEGIFDTYEDMHQKICAVIKQLDESEQMYKATNKKQFNACHKIYNAKFYNENLVRFYRKQFSYS
ncbi:MAG: hypothetical protein JEZ14_09285 [Marinilabiliaceae bacterium]|nr:hypothetical protein [Marinilabiliaceae bacterium]